MHTYDHTYQATLSTPSASFLEMDQQEKVNPASPAKGFTDAEILAHLGAPDYRVESLGKTNLVLVVGKGPLSERASGSRYNGSSTDLWHRCTVGNHDDTIMGKALLCHKSFIKKRK